MSKLKVWNGSEWVPIRMVKVWDGSKWVDRPGYYWTGTKWEPFTQQEIWIYDSGTEYISLVALSSTGVRKMSTYISMGATPPPHGGTTAVEIVTGVPVSLTDVDSIFLEWSEERYRTLNYGVRLRITTSSGGGASPVAEVVDWPYSDGRKILELPVSHISGSYYVRVVFGASNPPYADIDSSAIRVHRIWME